MRELIKPFLFTISFFLNISIFCQSFKLEKELNNKMIELSEIYKIDIKKELNNFENYLVSAEILENKKADSYIKLYKSITDIYSTKPVFYQSEYSLYDTIIKNSSQEAYNNFEQDFFNLIEQYKSREGYCQMLIAHIHPLFKTENCSQNSIKINEQLFKKAFKRDFYKNIILFSLITKKIEIAPPISIHQ